MSRAAASRLLLVTFVLAGLLAGCSSGGPLVDRVAALESSQNQLRTSLTELGAPDPDAQAATEATLAEVASMSDTVTALQTTLDALRSDLDAGSLEVDGRLTTAELDVAAVQASVTAMSATIATLTDRIASLQAQLDAHRSDPLAHG